MAEYKAVRSGTRGPGPLGGPRTRGPGPGVRHQGAGTRGPGPGVRSGTTSPTTVFNFPNVHPSQMHVSQGDTRPYSERGPIIDGFGNRSGLKPWQN